MAGRPRKESNQEKAQRAERLYRQTQELHHDLYVLKPAKMLKDPTWDSTTTDPADMIPIIHQHFFHTVDSAGRTLLDCSPIGGHFHEMIVTEQDSGPPKVECKSGPLKWAKIRRGTKFIRKKVPINSYDHHTHEVEYVQSEKFKPRKPNMEASAVMKAQADKETAKHIKVPQGTGDIVEGF